MTYNENMSPDENALASILVRVEKARIRVREARQAMDIEGLSTSAFHAAFEQVEAQEAKLAALIAKRDIIVARCRAAGLSYSR